MTQTIGPKPGAFEKEALDKLGYTSVRDLSEKAGLSPSTLAKFIRGQHEPTAVLIGSVLAETGEAFAKFFRVIERAD